MCQSRCVRGGRAIVRKLLSRFGRWKWVLLCVSGAGWIPPSFARADYPCPSPFQAFVGQQLLGRGGVLARISIEVRPRRECRQVWTFDIRNRSPGWHFRDVPRGARGVVCDRSPTNRMDSISGHQRFKVSCRESRPSDRTQSLGPPKSPSMTGKGSCSGNRAQHFAISGFTGKIHSAESSRISAIHGSNEIAAQGAFRLKNSPPG
jgi:hypothetical protein